MQNTKVNMVCMTCKETVLVFYYKEYKKVFEYTDMKHLWFLPRRWQSVRTFAPQVKVWCSNPSRDRSKS